MTITITVTSDTIVVEAVEFCEEYLLLEDEGILLLEDGDGLYLEGLAIIP